jgi:hypothetical protein
VPRIPPLIACLVLVGLTLSSACADGGTATTQVSVEPGPVSTLSGVVSVTSGTPVRLGVTAAADSGHEVRIPPPPTASTAYELPLVGLRPDTAYEITVDGVDETFDFHTGPLPPDFPPIDLEVVEGRATGGLTLLSLKPWAEPEGDDAAATPERGGYLAAVDQDGFVVWYHPTELGVLDARQLPNGNFLFTYDEVTVREVDVLGRLVRELAGRVALDVEPLHVSGARRATDGAIRMATDAAHHDVGPTPDGNLLLLSTELRELTGPSQCGEPTAETTYPIIADVVVEVVPDTGEVIGEWPLLDVFDPFVRPGAELCEIGSPFAPPNASYLHVEGARDWTHANSVVLDEERNALIVSLRHLSAVVAIRYTDDEDGPAGELLWELGPDGTLPLDGEPSTYQHAAEVLDDGGLLVYDNGNARPSAPLDGGGGTPYSRAVIYEVDDRSEDPSDWSARQVWEHVLENDDGRPVFTAFLGDVDALPGGNILVTHGAIADDAGGLTARVVEVERSTGDVVFDLRVGDAEHPWTVYRSQRFETLTPRS